MSASPTRSPSFGRGVIARVGCPSKSVAQGPSDTAAASLAPDVGHAADPPQKPSSPLLATSGASGEVSELLACAASLLGDNSRSSAASLSCDSDASTTGAGA